MQLRDGWNIDYTMGEKNLFFFSLKANKVKLTQLVRWTAVLSLSKGLCNNYLEGGGVLKLAK